MILLYPGSFDPVTMGHIDIAIRAAKMASRLIIGVLDNPAKKCLFSVEERVKLLQQNLAFEMYNVEVGSFSGLVVDCAREVGATAILRGLRNSADFEIERMYAENNSRLSESIGNNPGIPTLETIFMQSSPRFSHVSSSIVKEIASHIYAVHGRQEIGTRDQALCSMVSPVVMSALEEKYRLRGGV